MCPQAPTATVLPLIATEKPMSLAPALGGFEHIGTITPHERFSATKLGTVFGIVYRREHSKDAEVLRLSD